MAKLKNKTILVTGGHGFIAGHLVEYLLDQGAKVVITIRSNEVNPNLHPYLKREGVVIRLADNRDATLMRSIVEKCDGVINLAGILGTTIKSAFDYDVFVDNNINGSMNVAKACLAFKTPLVQIAVGNHFEHNFYSNTKTAVERDVLAFAKYLGLKANIVRGLNVYGERQKIKNTGKVVPTFISKALRNEPLSVYGGKDYCGLMDMIYVKDIAKILTEVLETTMFTDTTAQVFEAGTGKAFSVYEIAEKIIDLSKSKSLIVEVNMRDGESKRSEVVAKNPYKFTYSDFDSTLKDTIDWYRNINLNTI